MSTTARGLLEDDLARIEGELSNPAGNNRSHEAALKSERALLQFLLEGGGPRTLRELREALQRVDGNEVTVRGAPFAPQQARDRLWRWAQLLEA